MTIVHGAELRLERDRIALHVEEGKGDFEPETVAAFRAAIEADLEGCVIDVGAYTGLYTIVAMQAGAREIIALEPNRGGYDRLLENVETNGGNPGFIRILHAAASFQQGEAFLEITDESKGICSTGRVVYQPGNGAHIVKLVTIDSIEHRRPISVIKLDVEGHELAALSGAAVTLEAFNPVLFVEVKGGTLRSRGGDRTEAVCRFLRDFGYEGEILDGRNMVFRAP